MQYLKKYFYAQNYVHKFTTRMFHRVVNKAQVDLRVKIVEISQKQLKPCISIASGSRIVYQGPDAKECLLG